MRIQNAKTSVSLCLLIDLSAHSTKVEIWDAILENRLLSDSHYIALFATAFPTTSTASLNPGHIGRALGAFMKSRLKSANTPFDHDLAGELGRGAITGLAADRYKFKTPSLRNISLTAPYMHDGAFETLEAVVNHYNNVQASLAGYSILPSYQSHYEMTMVFDNDAARNQARINQIDNGRIRGGLGLNAQDRANLVDFLRNGLRDPDFQ